jgi:hypothetical protein
MANIYRAPKEPKKKPRKPDQKSKERKSTLEGVAAGANVRLVPGMKQIKNPKNDKNPYHQPFWFAHESGELTGVYVEAEKVVGADGTVFFLTADAKTKLRNLLLNYTIIKKSRMSDSLVQFGGCRGFDIKTAYAQPKAKTVRD